MVTVTINNRKIKVPTNTTIIEACEIAGFTIPRFCYHPKLNVAGNCRMCLVEIEKAPKPVASCAFPVSNNLKVFTNTPLVQKARENVLEFLLLNHPLDCPICDQGGECDLQDQALAFGSDRSRFFYPKRSTEDKNCGPLIKTIMTRCIHCTRCVRFFQEISEEDLGTTNRGKNTEIGMYIKKHFLSEFSGNIIDLCPVGALTSKPYAFSARPWELKSIESVDILDGVGVPIKLNLKETEILRILPQPQNDIEEEWISDKTRFVYDSFKLNRVSSPFIGDKHKKQAFKKISWKKALQTFMFSLIETIKKGEKNKILVLGGAFLDLESLNLLKNFTYHLNIDFKKEEHIYNNNLIMLNRVNTCLKNLNQTDFLLTIGVNPRAEAILYDLKIKLRSKKGGVLKSSIGNTEKFTYQNTYLGTTLKTFLQLLEGKHKLCKKFITAKKPILVFSSNYYQRLNSNTTLMPIIRHLNKYTSIIDQNWLGFSTISSNQNYLDINSNFVKNNLKNRKLLYIINPKKFESFNSTQTTIIQTPIINNSLAKEKNIDLIIPSSLFTEQKNAIFQNFEGKNQYVNKALPKIGVAEDNRKIIEHLNTLFGIGPESYYINKNLSINENAQDFTKNLLITKTSPNLRKLNYLYFKAKTNNFYKSDLITNNSKTLNKCAKLKEKNYYNFF